MQNYSTTVIPPPSLRLVGNPAIPVAAGARYFHSARQALMDVLASIAARNDKRELLLPAYVCDTVFAACDAAGFTPVRYRVDATLAPDLADVETRASEQTAALLVVHYFGWPAPVEQAEAWCRQLGIPLIEDAAHLDPFTWDGTSTGAIQADWLIASPRKFYATYDGGVAIARSPSQWQSRPAPPAGLKAELRAVRHAVSPPPRRRGYVARPATSMQDEPGAAPNQASPGFVDERFRLGPLGRMSRVSRFVVRVADRRDVSARRRENFSALLDGLASLKGCRPLFTSLPEGAVPYVFPLLLDRPHTQYPALRTSPVEVLRWEQLDAGDCPVCEDYQDRLVQLPCHQGLKPGDLTEIVDQVAALPGFEADAR